MQPVVRYPLYINTRTQNDTLGKIRLLKRSKLEKAVNTLLTFSEKGISGISLSTVGSIAYSDYSEYGYYTKGSLAQQITPLLQSIREGGHMLSVYAGNDYAAVAADSIAEVPLDNGGYITLDETIPFYQMVFGEYSALYSTAVNISTDAQATILRALETGVSPSFTLYAAYDEALADAGNIPYYGALFDHVHQDMAALLKETAGCFEHLGEQWIVDHDISANGVTKTTFSGGSVVWVNYGSQAVQMDGETLGAGDYRYIA